MSVGRQTKSAPVSSTEEPEALYAKSYLVVRTGVGLLGAALPTLLLVGENFLNRSFAFRGSLSAYYHSSVRDFFVGILWAIGFLLIVYLAWKPKDPAFVLSLIAGLGAIGLAVFPTGRPGPERAHPLRCDDRGISPTCTPLQHYLTEETSQRIHFTFTALFIGAALLLSALYAVREWRARRRRLSVAVVFAICAALMLLAVVWIAFGPDVVVGRWVFTSLYVGEVVAVYAFAVSWLTEVRRLWRFLRRRPRPEDYPGSSPEWA